MQGLCLHACGMNFKDWEGSPKQKVEPNTRKTLEFQEYATYNQP